MAGDIEYLQSIYPKCHRCGEPWSHKTTSAEDIAATAQLFRDNPAALAFFPRYCVCEQCQRDAHERQRESEAKLAEAAHARKAAWVTESCYSDNLMRADARDMTFDASLPEVEAMNPQVWKWARNWAYPNRAAWIKGPTGTGKTWLARSILNREMSVFARRCAEITGQMLTTASRSPIEGQALIDKLATVDVLLIDDMDKGVWVDSERQRPIAALHELLDRRFAMKKPVFVTANESCADLMKPIRNAIGWDHPKVTAIVDRFNVTPLTMTGDNLRHSLKRGHQTEIGET